MASVPQKKLWMLGRDWGLEFSGQSAFLVCRRLWVSFLAWIPALRRCIQEAQEFVAILYYMLSLRPLGYMSPCRRTKEKEEEEEYKEREAHKATMTPLILIVYTHSYRVLFPNMLHSLSRFPSYENLMWMASYVMRTFVISFVHLVPCHDHSLQLTNDVPVSGSSQPRPGPYEPKTSYVSPIPGP